MSEAKNEITEDSAFQDMINGNSNLDQVNDIQEDVSKVANSDLKDGGKTTEGKQEGGELSPEGKSLKDLQDSFNDDLSKEAEKNADPAAYWAKYGAEDEDSFKSTYEELKSKASKYEEESTVWGAKEKELMDTLESEKGKNSRYIEDDNLARLSVLKSTDKDQYDFFKSFVLNEKLDDRMVIGTAIAEQFPDFEDSDIDEYIEDKYGLNLAKPDEDDFADDAEYNKALKKYNLNVKVNTATMHKDAEKYHKEYISEFEKIELPTAKPVSKETVTLNKAEAKKAWQPYMNEFISSVGKMSVDIEVEGEKVSVPFELNKDAAAKFSNTITEMIHDNAIPLTKESYEQVATVARNLILQDQLSNIAKEVYLSATEKANNAWEAKINGGSASYSQSSKGAPTNNEDEAFNQLISSFK